MLTVEELEELDLIPTLIKVGGKYVCSGCGEEECQGCAGNVQRKKADDKPVVAVDLDGTLAQMYEEFDEDKIMPPRDGAKEQMQRLRDAGVTIVINTCRGNKQTIRAWLEEHEIPYDHINENPEQPDNTSDKVLAKAYIDDRAVSAKDSLSTAVTQALELVKQSDFTTDLREQRKVVERLPTPAQCAAGNYRMGHVRVHGMQLTIENAKGTTRVGYNDKGEETWRRKMIADYGYIKGTTGKDGDHVDAFLGPDPESELVYIVNQQAKDGSFDEHKVIFGCRTKDEAKELYLGHYPAGWTGLQSIHGLTVQQFKRWLWEGSQNRPYAPTRRKAATISLAKLAEGLHGGPMPYWQRGLYSQLRQPQWDLDQGPLVNITNNLQGAAAQARRLQTEDANTAKLRATVDPQGARQEVQEYLAAGPQPQDPIDQFILG